MIAVTQARGIGSGKTYVDKLIAGGKTRTEAMRLLRRRFSDVASARYSPTNKPQPTTSPAAPRRTWRRRLNLGASVYD
jgi:transposase